jgi:DNA-binding ferritin-like protein
MTFQVEKLRQQVLAQESVVKAAEAETNSRREAVQGLKKQEQQLEEELKQQNTQVDSLNDELQQSVLAISQVRLSVIFF